MNVYRSLVSANQNLPVCRLVHDRGDCEQRYAFAPFSYGSRWHSAFGDFDSLPGYVHLALRLRFWNNPAIGIFGLFTAKLLIDFKLNHPEVHNMGDAGYILFGNVGRELLSWGTIIFAIFGTVRSMVSHLLYLLLTPNRARSCYPGNKHFRHCQIMDFVLWIYS